MSDTIDPVALARRHAAVGAALAQGGAGLRTASLGVGLVAIGFGLVRWPIDHGAVSILVAGATVAQIVCLGLGQILGLRTAIDTALFADLVRDPDLSTFDAAMGDLGLLPAEKQGRAMEDRVGGLSRHLWRLGAIVALQLVLLLALVVAGGLP